MKNILFVHDTQEASDPRKAWLDCVGYCVTSCVSGDEAIAALESGEKYDLVLLDVLLRGSHGFNVCRRIRQSRTPQQLPIILSCVIYRTRAYREEAFAAGAQAYLLRPLAMDELVKTVNDAIAFAEAPVPEPTAVT